jgi:hypothetical protein
MTRGVTALSLKKESHLEIEITVRRARFGGGYVDGRRLG